MSTTRPGVDVERLFVGVPLPVEAKPFVAEAQHALPAIAGLRLIRPEQLHVTLAFLGGLGAEAREAARAVVAGVDVRSGGITRLGGFLFLPSPSKARVVALAIDDPDGVFSGLYEQVAAGLERGGVYRREKRPYLPHLTIARLREPRAVQPKSECGRVGFPVESVCLYKSELGREGARYTVLERMPLTMRDTESVE